MGKQCNLTSLPQAFSSVGQLPGIRSPSFKFILLLNPKAKKGGSRVVLDYGNKQKQNLSLFPAQVIIQYRGSSSTVFSHVMIQGHGPSPLWLCCSLETGPHHIHLGEALCPWVTLKTKAHIPVAKISHVASPRSQEAGKCSDQLHRELPSNNFVYGKWSIN